MSPIADTRYWRPPWAFRKANAGCGRQLSRERHRGIRKSRRIPKC